MMLDLSFLLPYLPFLGVLISMSVPIYLMRLQGKKLKSDIDETKQKINNAKTIEAKDQVTALETLERITNTTADELEKSLQKSITVRNLSEQVSIQTTQISQQTDIITLLTKKNEQFVIELASEKAARIEVEDKILILDSQLTAERVERQTAVAEIENLKSHSDEIIKKLTNRVKLLEDYIKANYLPLPNGAQDTV
jgi:hypothetical protein